MINPESSVEPRRSQQQSKHPNSQYTVAPCLRQGVLWREGHRYLEFGMDQQQAGRKVMEPDPMSPKLRDLGISSLTAVSPTQQRRLQEFSSPVSEDPSRQTLSRPFGTAMSPFPNFSVSPLRAGQSPLRMHRPLDIGDSWQVRSPPPSIINYDHY